MVWILAAITLIAIAAFFFSVALARRLRAMPRVLMLHSLSPHFPDIGAVSISRIEQLLGVVSNEGLRIAGLEEALADRRCIALTFDDGYNDLLALLPMLRNGQIRATIFMPTEHIGKLNSWDNLLLRGKRRHLTAEEIRTLAAAGAEFGSHGHTHRDLTALSDNDLRFELLESKRILTALSSREVIAIAFPFGRFDKRVTEAAKALGFRVQLTATTRATAPHVFGRIAVNGIDNGFTMRAKLRGSLVGGLEALKASIISSFSTLTPLARKIL